jgi:hypothetical protein
VTRALAQERAAMVAEVAFQVEAAGHPHSVAFAATY